MSKRVLAITGMPGAGKTEAANFFRSKNYPVISLGSIILRELDAKGLSHTPENEKFVREQLRQKRGMAACAIEILPELKNLLKKKDIVILEGIRSWEERQFLIEKVANLVIIAILAAAKIRYQRLSKRLNRRISPTAAFNRDMREIARLNICPTILLADKYIVNEGSKKEFYNNLQRIVKEINEEG